MQVFLSDIVDRKKVFLGDVAGVDDFTLGASRSVAPERVLSSPDWSLYSVDVTGNRALFVELPGGVDLAATPFMYMAQFERAQRAICMPLDLLDSLSQSVRLPANFGMLFSTGRCGSTLASHILAEVPGVWSISEPDVLTNLAMARFDVPHERMVRLIAAVTRLLFVPPAGRDIGTFVIKPRSESMTQIPEYALALPQSRNVFLYRDAIGFVNSLYQFVQKLIGAEAFFAPGAWKTGWKFAAVNAPMTLLDSYFPEGWDDIGFAELMLLSWVIRMDAYGAAGLQGTLMEPLHYRDLNASREQETLRLLTACWISADHLGGALRAFERDSQEGTGGDRDLPSRPLDAAQRQHLSDLLRRWGRRDYLAERLPSVKGAGGGRALT